MIHRNEALSLSAGPSGIVSVLVDDLAHRTDGEWTVASNSTGHAERGRLELFRRDDSTYEAAPQRDGCVDWLARQQHVHCECTRHEPR